MRIAKSRGLKPGELIADLVGGYEAVFDALVRLDGDKDHDI